MSIRILVEKILKPKSRLIIKTQKEFHRYLLLEKILKWLELLVLALILVFGFWIFYTSICQEQVCIQNSVTANSFSRYVAFGLPVIGIINNLRTAIVYRLNDPDNIPEKLFYTSLAGFSLVYLFFGIFNQHYLDLDIADTTPLSNIFWLLIIITFILSTGLTLLDKQTWHKTSEFVKWRVVVNILYLLVLVINPSLGLLFTLIAFPVITLVNPTFPKTLHDK